MMNYDWNREEPGKQYVLSGNEAVARGALEAGVRMVSSYPGSPSVQILECLAAVAGQRSIYAEWSINEKVALEVAAAGSFAGLRALSIMKADGLNVALDFLTTLPLSGIKGGLVLVVSDDPGAHSSVKEEDTRYLAPPAHVPLLEPSGPAEAKDIIIWAFDLSEKARLPVMVRLVTRICHARSNVDLGHILRTDGPPCFSAESTFITAGRFHPLSHQRLDALQDDLVNSPFNTYEGPINPELTVFASGVSYTYVLEAAERLAVGERVGILKIGTVWPLPQSLVVNVLKRSSTVLFLEEIEPFLEDQVKILAAQNWAEIESVRFLGKGSGDVPWVIKPRGMGEMDPDIAIQTLANALSLKFDADADQKEITETIATALELPVRLPSLCAGCPHRASFWAIKTALALDGRNGFALGDIGCYALGVGPTGYQTLRTVHSMGSGIGIASGFGKLKGMGFEQPVIAVIGDSTFYHAGVAPLINAKTNDSRYLCVILDNATTAMTGHQPHPGSPHTAMGETAHGLSLEELVSSLNIPVTTGNPFHVHDTVSTILELLQTNKLHVLLLQGECALKAGRSLSAMRVYVDPERCLGEDCGCARFCSRVFSCPANTWDEETGKARIDEVLCNGCGVCSALCPQNAIVIESERQDDVVDP
jgi:indolepyruvate ferredoxin oxidoreductase alpha subunit